MSTTADNDQASLGLTQLLPLTGYFPSRDGGGSAGIPFGSIRTFAGDFAHGKSLTAEGQLLSISQNQGFFSLLAGSRN